MPQNQFGVNIQADKKTIGIEENVSRLNVDQAAHLIYMLTQLIQGIRGGREALDEVFGEGNGPVSQKAS